MATMVTSFRLARGTAPVDDAERRLLADADAFLRARRWTDACLAFHQLAAKVPQERSYRARMHYARGRDHADAGRIALARAEFERATRLDSTLDDAVVMLGQLDAAANKGWRKLLNR